MTSSAHACSSSLVARVIVMNYWPISSVYRPNISPKGAKDEWRGNIIIRMRVIVMILVLVVTLFLGSAKSECEFKAIFNFGDSNSDTGGFYGAFPSQTAPFGTTFFNKPSGRASDGRLIIDFLGIIFFHDLCIYIINNFSLFFDSFCHRYEEENEFEFDFQHIMAPICFFLVSLYLCFCL